MVSGRWSVVGGRWSVIPSFLKEVRGILFSKLIISFIIVLLKVKRLNKIFNNQQEIFNDKIENHLASTRRGVMNIQFPISNFKFQTYYTTKKG